MDKTLAKQREISEYNQQLQYKGAFINYVSRFVRSYFLNRKPILGENLKLLRESCCAKKEEKNVVLATLLVFYINQLC